MRGMTSILTGATAFMTAAGALMAQQPTPRKEPPPARNEEPRGTVCFSTDENRTECNVLRRSSIDSVMMKRAALGLQLTSTGTARDTIGVFVSRVTPKGPAENAGIVEGDRIVSINGTDLRVSAADAGDSYAGELPGRRLSRAVEKLTPGNVVTLRVSSGGRIHDVQVTAGRASDLRDGPFGLAFGAGGLDGMFRSMPRMNMEDFREMRMEDMPMLRGRMQDLPMRLREMEMSPMRMRLRDGGTYKTLGPSRVHVMGPEGSVYTYRDSAGRKTWSTDAKTRAEKAAVEKAVEKAKKDKNKN